ncbi:DUF5696 domain-containing protein [Paenibacillus sacheonensis]|uniref:Uncharacterized protein n=1 Tax=Paenibacillus sacheonensis TaxID=742054 RepID=A0A7X4YVN9_9BACL|nr:DUF5696 domain-containing protein [Paenibacillus sacheonensis]MBM7568502.1 hypothetical protein [Paenibacillus sacheonensis]NBC72329.1 hypothetical protein [Paenibacillus sacheonensis]
MRIKAKRWLYYATVGCVVAALVLLALPSLRSAVERARTELDPAKAAAAAAAEADAAAEDEPAGGEPAPEPGAYERIAQTDRLELLFRASDSAIAVKDKSNGHLWESAVPQKEVSADGNELWTASSQSIFHLTFADPDLPALETQETNSALERPEMKTTPLDNGISVHYELPRLKMSFDMNFRLKDDALEVTIPGASIRESKNNWLMAISPLPFFGAATDRDQGYSVYPDGSGALSTFKRIHPTYLNPYRASVYGPDTIDFNSMTRQMNAMLPIFGQKVGDNAFLGMITEGEYDANILFSPSGYLIDLNRVSSELVYRRDYEAVKKDGNLTKKPEKDLIREDHTIRYVFLSGEEADYSHMAAAYRNYLVDEQGVQPRIKKGDPIPFGLDLLMGIKQDRILFDKFIATTTFDEAQQIMADLGRQGVGTISANLLGWTGKGYLAYPSGNEPSAKLGGLGGLEKLSEYAKKQGIQLFLQDNYVDAWKGIDGFSTRTDVVVGANHFAVTDRYSESFNLSAGKQNKQFQSKVLDPLRKLSVSGINFDGIGYQDYYDYNSDYPATREGTAAHWMQMMEKSVKQFGGAASIGGNGYSLKNSSRLFGIPMEDSGYFFTDETIPLYQMVVHGLIPYSGDAQNLFYDPQLQYLKMVEYGYMPYYQFTMNYADELKDTYYNDLFSSDYKSWSAQAIRQYKEMNEKLAPLWSQAMTSHRKLRKDLYEAAYEDGTRVFVNYSSGELQADSHTVPGKNFIVVPKEG